MNISDMPTVIDVSRWQGYIDWNQVRRNVDMAMIKIGGSDKGLYLDSMAQRNLLEARAAHMHIGTYVFLGGFHSISEEVHHIINLFNQLGGLRAGEPFALDWEKRRPGFDEVGYLVGIVEGLTKRGFPPPLIYMNLHYVQSQDWKSLVRRNCPLWVAAWGNNNAKPERHEVPFSQEWPEWAIWQYSSTGSVPGIAGRVDHNLLNGRLVTFKNMGLNHNLNVPGTPPPVPQPLPPEGSFELYTIKPHDTLSRIAAQYDKTWQQLYALNRDRISNPDRIFVGQKLRVWRNSYRQPQKPVEQPQNRFRTHKVANGENLSVIAHRYQVPSWRAIYNLNKSIIGDDPNFIKPGQLLKIPVI